MSGSTRKVKGKLVVVEDDEKGFFTLYFAPDKTTGHAVKLGRVNEKQANAICKAVGL